MKKLLSILLAVLLLGMSLGVSAVALAEQPPACEYSISTYDSAALSPIDRFFAFTESILDWLSSLTSWPSVLVVVAAWLLLPLIGLGFGLAMMILIPIQGIWLWQQGYLGAA